nr:PHP domain-containing protein [Deinococcus pimensis]
MRIDLHCHSEASHDCTTPLTTFPARCLERGVRVQAITDHDQIWGAQNLREFVASSEYAGRFTVIVGEEVTTRDGELVGLFLHERIPPGLSAEETVAEIRAQGGLVLLQHGLDPLKRYRLRPEARERIAHEIDIVETFNARISRPKWNRAAAEWAMARNLPMSGGSDAHTWRQIGDAWSETPERSIETPQDLLDALRAGSVMGEWTHPVRAFVYKQWVQWKERRVRT